MVECENKNCTTDINIRTSAYEPWDGDVTVRRIPEPPEDADFEDGVAGSAETSRYCSDECMFEAEFGMDTPSPTRLEADFASAVAMDSLDEYTVEQLEKMVPEVQKPAFLDIAIAEDDRKTAIELYENRLEELEQNE